MDKLKHIVKHLDDKKANNIVVLDVSEITPLAQYFIICDASNTTQLRSMADSLEKSLIKSNYGFHHKEGKKESGWILVDAQDIIIHIFLPNEREKYSLLTARRRLTRRRMSRGSSPTYGMMHSPGCMTGIGCWGLLFHLPGRMRWSILRFAGSLCDLLKKHILSFFAVFTYSVKK